MKRISVLLACVLSLATALPVQAHGYGHGGYHGGYHHDGGWRGGWMAPLVGAAIVGGAVYAATSPSYAAAPVVVTPSPVAPVPPRVAYFCSTSQQYYPNVPTCAVPWQLVSY